MANTTDNKFDIDKLFDECDSYDLYNNLVKYHHIYDIHQLHHSKKINELSSYINSTSLSVDKSDIDIFLDKMDIKFNHNNIKKRFSFHELRKITCILTYILSNIRKDDKDNKDDKVKLTPSDCFCSCSTKYISIQDYFFRLIYYTNSSILDIIYSAIYLDKFNVTIYNFHRCFLCALLCATKYNSDMYQNNNVFSRIGGISLYELNCREIDFLYDLSFDLYVDEKKMSETIKTIFGNEFLDEVLDEVMEEPHNPEYEFNINEVDCRINFN